MFAATETRNGEPLAVFFGPATHEDSGALKVVGGALNVALFFIRQGVTAQALDFENPDTGDRLRLAVPVTGRGLLNDAIALNADLEVIL